MRHLAWFVVLGFVCVASGSAQVVNPSCSVAVPMMTVIAQTGQSRQDLQVPMRVPVQVPYSLVRVSTQVQTLSNGVQVTSRTEMREWRDADGRTRNETRTERNGEMEIQNVSINDPVARENITLYPKAKVAQVNRFWVPASVEPRPVDKTFQENMRAFQEAMKPQYQAQQDTSRVENKNEQLGTAVIAGECAQGTRWTQVIPAGEMGNDSEMRSVNESWWSPRLGIQLRFVLDDPRQGHTVNEVTELHVENPDASVFQLPPEYQVFDLTPPQQ